MKKILVLITLLFSLALFTKIAEAKLLPQAARGGQKTTAIKSAAGAGISVYPHFRADRRALNVSFGNLQNAKSVSYALTYSTAEQQEGAIGTLPMNGTSSNSTELLFGTCSKNVCRYHTNISNMKLEVSYTSQSGNKYIKRYRMKV